MIAYTKKSYQSLSDAISDSYVLDNSIETIESDFKLLRKLRKKSFDSKFERVFGVTKRNFMKDSLNGLPEGM